MNSKLKVLGVGVLFFTGQALFAQQVKSDTTAKTSEIEEVTFTVFGQKKVLSESTGAIGVIKGDDIKSVPVASIDKILQGRVSGVMTGATSGQPGTPSVIRVRGITSYSGNNSPVYIIDGMRMTASQINMIPPEDIESFVVLKDASSAAVYGADAGAGVVVITTKSGKKGKPRVSLSFQSGFNDIATKTRENLSTDEWRLLMSHNFGNAWGKTPEQFIIDATAGVHGTALANIYTSKVNTDWSKAVENSGAPFQSASGSISGGSDNITYYSSASFMEQQGIIRGSDFRRLTTINKIDYKASDKLTIGANIQLGFSRTSLLPSGGAFANPMMAQLLNRPTDPVRNADGSYYLGGSNGRLSNSLFNVAYVQDNNILRNNSVRGFGNMYLNYKLLKNLKYALNISPEYINTEGHTYYNPTHGDGYAVSGRKIETVTRTFSYNIQNILSYDFSLAEKHNFDVRAMQEAYKRERKYLSAGATVTATDGFTLDNFVQVASTGGTFSKSSRQGYAGVLNYNYDKIIKVDASIRREGVDWFFEDKRWTTNYSAGLAVDLSKIGVVRDKLTYISNLSFRGSYGEFSNSIGTATPFAQYQYTLNYGDLPGAGVTGVESRNLGWEKVLPLSIGLDFGLFNNRITATVDYFNKITKDLTFSVPLSSSQGKLSYAQNIGKLENKGWEFSLEAKVIDDSDLKWSLGGNLTTLKNKMKRTFDGQPIIGGYTIVKEGESIGSFYMRKWAGVDPSNGNPLWYVNGKDGAVTSKYNDAKREVQGKNIMDLFGGFNTKFEFKNFYLDVLFTYGFGGKIYDDWASYAVSDGAYTYSYPGSRDQLDFWTPTNINAKNPKPMYGNSNSSSAMSTRFLSKTDFIRLSNIKVGYKFSRQTLRGSGLTGVEVFVQGNNIWTHLYDDSLRFDPEYNLNTYTDMNLPSMKTYTLGVNLQF